MEYTCAAVIIETRWNVDNIIEEHKKFLPPDWKVIHIKDVIINGLNDYNNLLTSKEFWESLNADKVLIFQHDSRLLRHGIEAFMEFDYIGASIRGTTCFNGGLSLRDTKMMIRVIEEVPYDGSNEDMYFSNGVRKLGGKLPNFDEAQRFSVETVYAKGSLGYHNIKDHLGIWECQQIMNQYQ